MSGEKRKRRSFTPEFKAQIVRLVLDEKKSITQVAREHDLQRTSVHGWVEQAKTDAGKGPPDALTSSERDELQRLRRENKRLQMEREILKKRRPSSPKRTREVCVYRGGEGLLPSGCTVQAS